MVFLSILQWSCTDHGFIADRLRQQIQEIKSGKRTEAVCLHAGINHRQYALLTELIQACGAVGSKVAALDLTVRSL